jgi:hypothetical protein
MQPAARRVELSLPSEQVSICNIVRRGNLENRPKSYSGNYFCYPHAPQGSYYSEESPLHQRDARAILT